MNFGNRSSNLPARLVFVRLLSLFCDDFCRGAVLAAALISTAATCAASPRIEVAEPIWDFGSVTNATEITHAFTVRSVGDADLEISRVKSSCDSCLRTRLDKAQIPPGETTPLNCRLDLRGLSGAVSRTATLECNDPDHAVVSLGLSGEVIPCYRVAPPDPVLDLSQGQKAVSVEIEALAPLRAPLSQVVCDDTNLLVQIAAVSSNRYSVSIQATEKLAFGRRALTVTLRSADTNDLPCRVTGMILHPADLELLPASLRFEPRAEPQMRIIWIKQHGPSPLQLLDVIPPSKNFDCEIDPGPGGGDYRVYLSAAQLDTMAGQTNTLLLKFCDARQQERIETVPLRVSALADGKAAQQ